MPRQARLDAPGTLHHVMIRGIERSPIFKDDQDRQDFISRMGMLAQETGTKILAWALMSNHVHLLFFSGPSGISKFMRRLLTGYALRYNRRHQYKACGVRPWVFGFNFSFISRVESRSINFSYGFPRGGLGRCIIGFTSIRSIHIIDC